MCRPHYESMQIVTDRAARAVLSTLWLHCSVLFGIIYVWSALGMLLFPNNRLRLDAKDDGYYIYTQRIQFLDMLSSMLIMTQVLVLANC